MYISPKMDHIKEVLHPNWPFGVALYCTTISVSFLYILFYVFQMIIIWLRTILEYK